jgi:hypothetical protein
MFGVVSSADQTSTFVLPQANVISIAHNFVPAGDTNNRTENSFALKSLQNNGAKARLDRVSFARNGQRLGNDYTMDVEQAERDGINPTAVFVNNINAFQDFRKTTHLSATSETMGFGAAPKSARGGAFTPTSSDASEVFGIGLCVDPFRNGAPFAGQSYAVRLQSGIDGTQQNSMFTHVLSKSVLSYSPKGVTVTG